MGDGLNCTVTEWITDYTSDLSFVGFAEQCTVIELIEEEEDGL